VCYKPLIMYKYEYYNRIEYNLYIINADIIWLLITNYDFVDTKRLSNKFQNYYRFDFILWRILYYIIIFVNHYNYYEPCIPIICYKLIFYNQLVINFTHF